MATYFHGGVSENSEGLHTLYLMNPNYGPYSDTHSHAPPNMLTLPHALAPSSLPHAPPLAAHFVGIPLPDATPRPPHEVSALQRHHYGLWAPPTDQAHTAQQQGLSLSLFSQQSLYRTLSAEQEIQGGGGGGGAAASGNSPASASVVSSGISGAQSVILGSKYLKAAQQLLDEVVNVGKETEATNKDKMKMKKESTAAIGELSSAAATDAAAKPAAAELSTAQRQDLQMKKAKLIGMLDEVEQKYREYHQQMQGVVSSFEQAAGLGSAKSYASLALRTISKQFRCLKDAICSQIKATGKSLGEEEWLGGKIQGSRLRYVDHHLRQQRALQQLGMIQHNTWRPQRGLPERAVSVLRAWLFEHFLHPYPKDSDKIILAKQTGLTRSQVSNWFINARVRLWKPMVEEMYLEEIKEQEQNGEPHDTNKNNNKNEHNKQQHGPGGAGDHQNRNNAEANFKSMNKDHPQSNSSSSSMLGSFNLVRPPSSDIMGSPKKPRTNNNNNTNLESSCDPPTKTMLLRDQINDMNHAPAPSFGAYPMPEIGSRTTFNPELLTPRFHGNGVSLTLGLPHSHSHSDHTLSLSATTQHNYRTLHFGGTRVDLGNNNNVSPDFPDIAPPPPPPPSVAYDRVEMQTTKRFAAQLLPDFVA